MDAHKHYSVDGRKQIEKCLIQLTIVQRTVLLRDESVPQLRPPASFFASLVKVNNNNNNFHQQQQQGAEGQDTNTVFIHRCIAVGEGSRSKGKALERIHVT